MPTITKKHIKRILPFILMTVTILFDQITKLLVILNLEIRRPVNIIGDFLRFTFVRNKDIAFSLGRGIPSPWHEILTLVLPIILLICLVIFLIRSAKSLPFYQQMILGAITGGGCGNVFDRVFRPEGVVDFIDVKFFGLFGFDRWPTFNIADSTIVVSVSILILSMIIPEIVALVKKVKKASAKEEENNE